MIKIDKKMSSRYPDIIYILYVKNTILFNVSRVFNETWAILKLQAFSGAKHKLNRKKINGKWK